MSVIEIVFAILLILSCVFIILVVLMQESKQGMSNVISGGSSDNYFQKNSGRTREAKLSRATKVAAVLLFIVAIAVNLITVYFSGNSSDASDIADSIVFDTTAAEDDADVIIENDDDVVIEEENAASDTTTAATEAPATEAAG